MGTCPGFSGILKGRMTAMGKKQETTMSLLDKLHTSGAGYDVLRYIGLPELFGAEKDTLLYFLGKALARKFAIKDFNDISYIFEQMGWGTLELINEKRKEFVFYLLSDSVVRRLTSPIEADFRLEAGFLAEAVQSVKEVECECIETINRKIHQIQFRVVITD